MSEGDISGSDITENSVKTGDVFVMKFSVIPFMLLVTTNDCVDDPVYGSKMSVCWLQHPDVAKEGHIEWLWEKTLKDPTVWEKLASAKDT